MELYEPRRAAVSAERGTLENGNARYVKTFRDLEGLYADADAFAELLAARGDEIAYEVTTLTPEPTGADLISGVTRMAPGKVGDEYFLTRGHIHARADRPEVYFGQKGLGVMVMESPEGEVRVAEIGPQTVLYVPPYWIHRTVNVGAGEFVMFFAYAADAGQDYGIIARSGGMKVRIVDDGRGGWREIANAGYRPRSPEEVAAILATAEAPRRRTA